MYKRLYGREVAPPRQDFCVKYVKGNLGTSIGSMFVKRYFDGQSKDDVNGGRETGGVNMFTW